MTSEQIVARAKINARLEAARRSGDVPEMQRCLAEDMAVLRSVRRPFGRRSGFPLTMLMSAGACSC